MTSKEKEVQKQITAFQPELMKKMTRRERREFVKRLSKRM